MGFARGMMAGRASYSLGELEALVKLAARGAGYEWGLAEDAGSAARWLAGRGIAPDAAFIWLFSVDQETRTPHCPLRQGAYLSDLNQPALLPAEVEVISPEILVPFLAWSLRGQGGVIHASSAHCSFSVSERHMAYEQADFGDAQAQVLALSYAPSGELEQDTVPPARPVIERWAALETLAARTYVPDTEESRRRGAGET